jgi:ribosome assembly protein 3
LQVEEQPDFASFYLRKVAMELEDDLDKIRSAGDFKQSSLDLLISALRQGESIFSADEKRQVMQSGL